MRFAFIRAHADEQLGTRIAVIHTQSRQTYGAPRVHMELRVSHGVRCGRKRVARLMRHAGLGGTPPRRFRVVTTDSRHRYPIAPNHVAQDFAVAAPNRDASEELRRRSPPRPQWREDALGAPDAAETSRHLVAA
ncbi:MAG TPA: IS3 family transposase [Candidatus Margulisiibacteriota bacterium]|nr:IS3 family transposase [Candidatus Margulisiibacteriota bacterium]